MSKRPKPALAPDADLPATVHPHPAARSVEHIVNQIKQGIRERRYVPGQRLIEADLAAEFGVKRQPVRDALRVLAGDGIVELIPQRGARVRKLDLDDMREIFPVLSGLLSIAIRLAIDRLGRPEIRARLEAALESMRHARRLEDLVQFHRAGLAYGALIQQAAGNRYLDYLHGKLHPDLFHFQMNSQIRVQNWDGYLAHFERMHEALVGGDLPRALELVAEHERAMLALFAGDGPAVWR